MRLGIITGTGTGGGYAPEGELLAVETPWGGVELTLAACGDRELLLLARHGPDHSVPPHRIDHRAHLRALAVAGVKAVLATTSCGSLRNDWEPGMLVVPDDYIGPWQPVTFHDRFDDGPVHVVPGLDDGLRRRLLAAAAALGHAAHDGGVYLQTNGPRLETRAEVRLFRRWADLMGMTMSAEATLAREAGLPYAAFCRVDNLAHGLGGELDTDALLATARASAATAWQVLLKAAELWEPEEPREG